MFNGVLTSVSCLISKGRSALPSSQARNHHSTLHSKQKRSACRSLTSNENDCPPAKGEELLSSTEAAITEIKADISLLMLWEGGSGFVRNGTQPWAGEVQADHPVFAGNFLEDLCFI